MKKIYIKKTTFTTYLSLLKKYYVLLIFLGCIGYVGAQLAYRTFVQKSTHVYVRVKIGQGYWWASTQRPSLWFVKGVEKQLEEQKNKIGESTAKILDISYFPYYGTGQYDIYVTAQLKVSKVGGKSAYSFNRELIGVGSPISLDFETIQFSGTIIKISSEPISEAYVEKTVYITKRSNQAWEFDAIKVGDTFTNGKKVIFEVLEKMESDRYSGFATGQTSGVINEQGLSLTGTIQTFPVDIETYTYITLKTKMLLKKDNNQFVFGEDLVMSPGRQFGMLIPSSTLNNYIVTKVE